MFGLGAQEVLLLLCCGGLPLAAVVVAFMTGRLSARKPARADDDDDF